MEIHRTIERGAFPPWSRSGTSWARLLVASSPLHAALYLWAGAFWMWLLFDVFSDQYPALFAALMQ